MAALTAAHSNAGSPARARRLKLSVASLAPWLMTVLHGLAGEWIAEMRQPVHDDRKQRRYYPPKRDRVIEQAAMAREMYRL